MPDRVPSGRPATTHHHLKGSDHDYDQPEDGRGTGEAGTNTPDGDSGDSPHDGNGADAESPRQGRQGTAARRAQRAVDASPPSPTGHQARLGPVTLKATPEGAVWVMVEGADLTELADRISAVCDALTPPPR